jgi:hypothetical protein
MAKSIPIVQGGVVVDDNTTGPAIQLDTPAWFAWLEAATTMRFSYALFNRSRGYIDGFMTVRKERRQRGTTYWTVYRRQGQHLCKVYVGPSTALTQARLEEIAAQLSAQTDPTTNPHFFVDASSDIVRKKPRRATNLEEKNLAEPDSSTRRHFQRPTADIFDDRVFSNPTFVLIFSTASR